MFKICLSLYLICCSFFSLGQIDEVRRVTKTLCSPEFHGRGYVNGGDSIAASFIASEFEKLGLLPLKESFLQPFSFQVNSFPGDMGVLKDSIALKPGVHFMIDPNSRGSKSTWRPLLISYETATNSKKLSQAIKEIKSSDKYNAAAFNFSGLTGDSLKQTQGIVTSVAGVMPVINVVNSKFTWSVGRTQYEYPLLHVQDSIFSENSAWKMDMDSKFIPRHVANNVVAYLPCKKKNAPTIVYTAHYDHLGRMGTETYFPGGNDNASGTAMLISMAKYFKENPVQCNLVFIAFAGEEAGLIGSEYFVQNPMLKLKKIKFLINLDIMGSGEEGITVVNGTEFVDQFNTLKAINDEFKLLAEVKERGPTQNSDHYWFTTQGVPAFFIYTRGPNKNYHDIYDTYENLSFQEYEDITTLLVKFTQSFISK
jgi:aminopeptidase YwaD